MSFNNIFRVPEIQKEATTQDAIELCKILYKPLKEIGVFIGLTGGLLYKEGSRKDIDLVIYRHRQDRQSLETIDQDVYTVLCECGLVDIQYYGFVTKAKWEGFVVDIMNPEALDDEIAYGEEG